MEKESWKARSGFPAFLDNYFYKKESTFFRTGHKIGAYSVSISPYYEVGSGFEPL